MTATLTLSLDDALAARLQDLAKTQGLTPQDLVLASIEHHLDAALRHKVLLERQETVDRQIDAIAQFIEQASSGGGLDPVDLFRICRYPRKKP